MYSPLHIFDKAIDLIPVYVAMQKKCFEDWLKSVGTEYEKQLRMESF